MFSAFSPTYRHELPTDVVLSCSAIGEVWAEMLYEMAVLLIAEHGFHSGLFPPASNKTSSDFYVDSTAAKLVPKYGNTLAVQLVVDGLKLQPCRPSFQDARDAILEADVVLTKGANACLIWKAFAKRGLGPDAAVIGSTPWYVPILPPPLVTISILTLLVIVGEEEFERKITPFPRSASSRVSFTNIVPSHPSHLHPSCFPPCLLTRDCGLLYQISALGYVFPRTFMLSRSLARQFHSPHSHSLPLSLSTFSQWMK